jgi:hypothetical protein
MEPGFCMAYRHLTIEKLRAQRRVIEQGKATKQPLYVEEETCRLTEKNVRIVKTSRRTTPLFEMGLGAYGATPNDERRHVGQKFEAFYIAALKERCCETLPHDARPLPHHFGGNCVPLALFANSTIYEHTNSTRGRVQYPEVCRLFPMTQFLSLCPVARQVLLDSSSTPRKGASQWITHVIHPCHQL